MTGVGGSLRFLGAADTVTGSRYLVERSDRRVLVDCGLFQGFKVLRARNRAPFPVDPSSIDAVIPTHATWITPATCRRSSVTASAVPSSRVEARPNSVRSCSPTAPTSWKRRRGPLPEADGLGTSILVRCTTPETPSGRCAGCNPRHGRSAGRSRRDRPQGRSSRRGRSHTGLRRGSDRDHPPPPLPPASGGRHPRHPDLRQQSDGRQRRGRVSQARHGTPDRPGRTRPDLRPGHDDQERRRWGAALLAGAETVRVFGKDVPVRAEVHHLHTMSAHADARQTIDWMRTGSRPDMVYVTHGEPAVADALRLRIERELHCAARVPDHGEKVTI